MPGRFNFNLLNKAAALWKTDFSQDCWWKFTALVRPGARIAWLGGGGGGGVGRNKFWGEQEVYFVWIGEGRGGTRNLSQSGSNEQGEEQRFKRIFRPKSKIQAVFPAENWWSPKKRFSLKFQGIFRPKSLIQVVFLAECRWSPKKKRSSSQKRNEIRS